MDRPHTLFSCVVALLFGCCAFSACSDDTEPKEDPPSTTTNTGTTGTTGTSSTTTGTGTTGTGTTGTGTTGTGTTGTTSTGTTGTTTTGPTCEEDALSPNHSVDDAEPVDLGASFDDLKICPTVRDYFSIDLEEGDLVAVDVLFDHEEGDLDLFILSPGVTDEAQAFADSLSVDDNEQTAFGAFEAGTYTILVAGYQQASASYSLRISEGCQNDSDCSDGVCNRILAACVDAFNPTCGDDDLEPNSTDSTAVVLERESGENTYPNLGICNDDLDMWTVDLEDGDSVEVTLTTETDVLLGIFVLDENGSILAQVADDESSTQRLSLPFVTAGQVTFLVTALSGPGSAITTSYDASFVITSGGCSEDFNCAATGDRLFCQEDGSCSTIEGDGAVPLGGVCDSGDDCDDEADGCYVGPQDPSAFICTKVCRQDADCADIPGTYCLEDTGVCGRPCETDAQCTTRETCTLEGQCASLSCLQDADCEGDTQCVYDEAGFGLRGLCQTFEAPTCGQTNPEEPNDTTSLATPLALEDDNTTRINSKQICPDDIDIYSIDIPEAGTLSLQLLYGGPTNLDIYLIQEGGTRPVALGTSRNESEEDAIGEFIAPGRYFIQIIQYPGERPETFYSLDITFEPGGCESDASCLSTSALRLVCEENACEGFEGNGSVALGGLCDSLDDCVADANFCFAIPEAAQRAANICTVECESNEDCADIDGTTCQPTSVAFFCLP